MNLRLFLGIGLVIIGFFWNDITKLADKKVEVTAKEVESDLPF